MRLTLVLLCTFPLSYVSAQNATIEIGGIDVSIGMLESEIRYAFAKSHCKENLPGEDVTLVRCVAGDGVLPEYDGHVSFLDGRVVGASRYWHLPDGAGPYEVLLALNSIIARLTAESSTCAEIASPLQEHPEVTSSLFYFPEKVVYLQTQKIAEPRPPQYFIHEFLRKNPVPDSYEVQQSTTGTKRCAFVE